MKGGNGTGCGAAIRNAGKDLKQSRAEPLEAQAEQAKREIAALAAAVRHAQSSLVDPSLCRDCWVDHGELNAFIAPRSAGDTVARCRRGHEKYPR